ncbi:MAG: SemiSWEET family sugar transporter [Bacteroidales bacterium]|nr:SemiSWEET family sugar transporter [Bacteroidales bacterium]
MNWITIIGLVAASCTTISFLPQAVKIIKTKHTKDLSLGMYILFSAGVLFWLLYGILTKDLPVLLANAITLSLSVVILFFKIKYK